MGSWRSLVVWAAATLLLVSSSCRAVSVSSCDTSYSLPNGTVKTFAQCQTLTVQNARIAWNYFPGENSSDGTSAGGILDLAFSNVLLTAGGWLGWGINPSELRMPGSSVLVAFTDDSIGSAAVLPYKLSFDLEGSPAPTLVSSPNDLDVLDKSVQINSVSLESTIYATLMLKPGQTTINHIWNRGPSVTGQSPNPHDTSSKEFLTSVGTLDVTTGTVTFVGRENQGLRNKHGVIQAIAWGFLFPLGIMSARYMRPFAIFDPLWFYVHVSSQICGYILGVAGWAIGIKIMDKAVVKYKHRNIGISLFVLATVQMLALLLRPKPDHKLRKYWNVWHHTVGYSILILSIINIFEGFHLLQPAKGWKHAYVGVLVALAAIALILEVVTWMVWFKRRSTTTRRFDGNKRENGHTEEDVLKKAANGNNNYKYGPQDL